MKVNAASLSNDVLCHLKSYDHLKSFHLSGNNTVVFEQEIFQFEVQNQWRVLVNHQWIHLSFEKTAVVKLSEYKEIEINLFHWKASWNQINDLKIDKKAVLGSSAGCEGVLDDGFDAQCIEFEKRGNQIHYRVLNGSWCAVNGAVSACQASIEAPALIQVGPLSVFISDEAVLYNCGVRKEPCKIPICTVESITRLPIASRYTADAQIPEPEIIEPEFPSLSENRGVSLLSIGPMLTMSCASLISALISYQHTGSQSVLIMPVMMLFSALFWPLAGAFAEFLKQRKWKKHCREVYLEACQKQIETLNKLKQDKRKGQICPDQLKSHEVWQIRQGHSYYFKVPLGYGSASTGWKIKRALKQPDITETQCLKLKDDLILTGTVMEDVLILCDLNEKQKIAFSLSSSMLETTAVSIIASMGVLIDLSEVHYVLICSKESINYRFRTTELFRFQKEMLIVDDTVSQHELEGLLSRLNLDRTVVFLVDTKRYDLLPDVMKQKLKNHCICRSCIRHL